MTRRLLIPAFIIAALSCAQAGDKTNFFTANNGLGAVAAADLGLYLGSIAFRQPVQWEGYELGNGVAAGDFVSHGDCVSPDAANVAKALIAAPSAEPPAGVIRTERLSPATADEKPFDMKAIYQPGQAVTCPQPHQ